MNKKKGLENKKTRNLINQKFNKLSVFKLSEIRTTDGKITWDCKCDCGNIKYGVPSYDLRSGKVKSCGCILRMSGKNKFGWKGYEEISGRYWSSVKRAAENGNILFNITIENAWETFIKQNRKCALTGLDLKFSHTTRNSDGNASIDRIDSKRGYEIGNIQWVHKWINIMKWDLTSKEFIDMCKLVVNHNQ